MREKEREREKRERGGGIDYIDRKTERDRE